AGDPVVLGAILRDDRQPVSARLTARLAGPKGTAGDPVELFDDGLHGDGAAGDGAYAARVDGAASMPGFWSVRFDASGQDARGASFERTSSSGFMTESGAASLDATRATLRSGLHVAAVADVKVAGRYRLDVIVATPPDADGRQRGVAWAQAPKTLAVGRTPLSLTVSADSLGEAAGGPFFVDVRLIGLDAPGVSRTTLEVKPAR
ncbi:MAG TPA: choice-of-anchor X domain-containing protein, partial [Vicinamibacteria bacterium]|nr:choice-of-anchor X domain-containing protein [Vicinamibacteria bacterium]